MIEISIYDIIAAVVGILLFWILVYSSEKDKFNETQAWVIPAGYFDKAKQLKKALCC